MTAANRAVLSTAKGLSFEIREMRDSDVKHIVGSWFGTFRRNGYAAQFIGEDVLKPFYRAVIENILKTAQVLVAVYPEADDIIIGWMVREPNAPIVHYVFVDKVSRRLGIAKALLKPLGDRFHFTQLTNHAAEILSHHFPSAWTLRNPNSQETHAMRGRDGPIYNPFLIPALTGAADWRPKL